MTSQPEPTRVPVEGRRPFAVVSKVLFPVALLLCLGFVVLPRDWHMGGRLVILRPWVPWTLFVVPVVCLVVLLLGAMASRVRYAGERPGCTFGVVVVAFTLAVSLDWFFYEGDWEPGISVRAPDGETYFLLKREEFFLGYSEALGRLTARSPFHRSFEVLGEDSSWDVPDPVLVVRRAKPRWPDGEGLAFAPNGELLVLYGRQWQMYYDPTSGTFRADRQLSEISPFILIDETADLNSADVDALIERIRSGWEYDPRRPTRETLVEALDHTNPNVRAAAAKMLEAFEPAQDDDTQEPM